MSIPDFLKLIGGSSPAIFAARLGNLVRLERTVNMRSTGASERLAVELEAEFTEALTEYQSALSDADGVYKALKRARRRTERYPDRPAPEGQAAHELQALLAGKMNTLAVRRERLFRADDRLGDTPGIDFTDIPRRALAAASRSA